MSDTHTIATAEQVPSQVNVNGEHQLPAKQRLNIVAGHAPRAIVPQTFDEAWRIATAIERAGVTPYGMETAEKCMIAIMHGLEVGMTPMAAIQSIAIINNRPCIFGDGAMALVRSSGKVEWIEETFSGTPYNDDYTATCRAKRKDEPKPIIYTFSVADAKLSGLWEKTGRTGSKTPWQLYPKRMLQMRARAFALRDGFADVLRGLGIREELEDIERLKDVTPTQETEAPPRALAGPPRHVPSNDKPAVESPSVAATDDGKAVEAEVAKPATSGPPSHVPEKKQEEQPQASGPMPGPEDRSAFLEWIRRRMKECPDTDAVMLTWTDEVYERVPNDMFDAANEIVQSRLADLGGKP